MRNHQLNLLFAIRDSWSKSKNVEAKTRGKKLAEMLDENTNNIITEEWQSNMKCDPPENVKPSLMAQLKK